MIFVGAERPRQSSQVLSIITLRAVNTSGSYFGNRLFNVFVVFDEGIGFGTVGRSLAHQFSKLPLDRLHRDEFTMQFLPYARI